jgi:hypothetical protein
MQQLVYEVWPMINRKVRKMKDGQLQSDMHCSTLYCDSLKYMLINNTMVLVKREVFYLTTLSIDKTRVLVVDKCEMSMKRGKRKYSKTHPSATPFTIKPL